MNNLRFLKQGLPFFSIVGGGLFALYFFQQVRYDFRQQTKEIEGFKEMKKELVEAGVVLKEKVTIEDIYNEILEIDVDNWENVRGPRPYEDNKEFLKAKEKQQKEAAEKRLKKK